MAQERPKTSQRAPETPPETPQDGPQICTIIDLGHPLAPQGSRNPSETLNPSKKHPKSAQEGPPKGAKMAPGSPQEGREGPQRAPRSLAEDPLIAQEAPKKPPRWLLIADEAEIFTSGLPRSLLHNPHIHQPSPAECA